MRKIDTVLLFFSTMSVVAQSFTFNHGGLTRNYIYFAPNNLPANAPLVFVLHGYGGSAVDIRNYTRMNTVANVNDFAVCYPQGTKDDWNNNFWNVGYDFHQSETVNDSDFLKSLALHLQSTFNLNPQFTFATGMSNGGDMSYMLACEQSETFKAIAPVAGSMMKWIYDGCPQNAVPVLKISGDNDNTTLWEGDLDNSDGWGAYMPALSTLDFWLQQNSTSSSIITYLPNTNRNDGSTVTRTKYIGGINNNEVWFYRVINGGHDWPGSSGNMDIDSSIEIWNFFSNYMSNNILSLPEIKIEEVKLYPNPVKNVVNVRMDTFKEGRYSLFSSQGKFLQKGVVSSHSNNIDISTLSNGIYLLKLEDKIYKIIKDTHQ